MISADVLPEGWMLEMLIRTSKDLHNISLQEEQLGSDMEDAELVILNGISKFPGTQSCTRHALRADAEKTSNRGKKRKTVAASLLDYALCHVSSLPMVQELLIHNMASLSDHACVEMRITLKTQARSNLTLDKDKTQPGRQSSKYYVLGSIGIEKLEEAMTIYLESFADHDMTTR